MVANCLVKSRVHERSVYSVKAHMLELDWDFGLRSDFGPPLSVQTSLFVHTGSLHEIDNDCDAIPVTLFTA